ncbi:LytR cell envelope-related transcriptional attenuator [Streptomyces sp. 846.5]|nr:LytR C-terminal domain-containing protein [Streptomyces sp. 846.5]TDU05478.1 LytR cell envelope-related transcriptional attenuator [Streptomyces sp. 846.5]
MSMLTPPGLKGKQYRITGTTYPRLARPNTRRRRIVQSVSGVVVLAVLSWGTVQLVDVFGGGHKKTAAAGCTRTTTAAGAAAGTAGSADKASAAPSGSAPASASPVAAAFAALVPGAVPKPAAVTVNVYNATNRAGLAGQTAAELKKRGFTIGKIGNAPAALENKVPGSAQVTGGKAGAAMMTLLGTEVSGSHPVTDKRNDTTVDLVLGNGFSALATPAQAAQAVALASRPSPSATAAHC